MAATIDDLVHYNASIVSKEITLGSRVGISLATNGSVGDSEVCKAYRFTIS